MSTHVTTGDTVAETGGFITGPILQPTLDPIVLKAAMGLASALTASLANGIYGRLIFANTNVPAGSTLIGNTAEAAFPLSVTIPANTVVPGTALTIRIRGVYTTTSATVGSLTLKLKLNGVTVETGTMTALNFVATNSSFFSSSDIHCFSASQSLAEGLLIAGDVNNGAHIVSFANTAPSAIDWTVDQVATVTATWNAVLTSTNITLNQLAAYVDPKPN